MPIIDKELQSAILRSDLAAFTQKVFHTLLPATRFHDNWHIHATVAALQKWTDGDIKRLIVLMPPRMGKSLICSVALPAFLFMRNPSARIMCLSYSGELATKHHNDMRKILKSPWFQQLNPKLRLRTLTRGEQSTRDTDRLIETTAHGSRYSTSFGASITGFGAERIILDDPMNASLAASESERRRINDTFDTAISSRLDSMKGGRMLLVMQRLDVDDLAGHLMRKGGWDVLRIPAIAQEDEEYDLGNGQTCFRPKGSFIDETRAGAAEMELAERDLGWRGFETQYLLDPKPRDGGIIMRKDLRFVDTVPDFQYVVITVDVAGSQNRGDYSAFLVWGYRDEVWYLTAVYRERRRFADVVLFYRKLDERHEPDVAVVEQNGLGAPFVERLRELQLWNVQGAIVAGDKRTRTEAITPLLERGQLAVVKGISLLDVYLEEVLSFPAGPHDDMVDATTLLFNHQEDILRVANQYRRPKRQHMEQARGATLNVTITSVSLRGSGNRYADRNDTPLW